MYFYNLNRNNQLVYSLKFKYNWIEIYNDLNKFYFNFSNDNFFTEFFNINLNFNNNKFENLKKIIFYKNNTNIYKNNINIIMSFNNYI